MDRQDIDALLIGALYGELTPVDEARLAAHLESHPGDRGALDDLKITRQAVLDSRIFSVQLEPPQAVSALLLQEAHRRAPKRVVAVESEQNEGGWFYRFTRSFMAHPAMAAAAMLVLVLGGAGIAYMRNGEQFADKQIAAPSVEATQAADHGRAEAMPAAQPALAEGAAGSGSAFNAGLYDPAPALAAEKADGADRDGEAVAQTGTAFAADQKQTSERKKDAKASRGIAVSTTKGSVKELESAKPSNNDSFGFDDLSGGGRAGAGTIGGAKPRAADSGYAAPPPPAAVAAAPTGAPTKSVSSTMTTPPRSPEPKPTQTIAKDKAPAETTKREDSTLLAWAKGEHQRAVSLAQRGECSTAAKVALGVSSKAGDYYVQHMATDRALKQCAAYINAERDRDAERSGKARTQKRQNAEESAPTNTK